jgi:hypothetical protein
MAHNHDRPLSFNIEEASILSENNIRVWKLPDGWRIRRAAWMCPPFCRRGRRWMPTSSAGAEPPKQRNSPDWASNSVLWRSLFQEEWCNAIADFDIGTPTHT